MAGNRAAGASRRDLRTSRRVEQVATAQLLESRTLLTFALTQVSYIPSAIAADPVRNVAYIADSSKPEVIVLDTQTGTMTAHPLAAPAHAVTCSLDGSELFVAEGTKIQVFALPGWTLARTLALDIAPNALFAGVNHRIYAEHTSSEYDQDETTVEQLNATTGQVIDTLSRSGCVGVSPDGTQLAGFETGASGVDENYPYYDIAGDGFVSLGTYLAPCANGQEVIPDPQMKRIYTASGGVYGVNVTDLTTGKQTLWKGADAYGDAVTFNAAANRVYGANYMSIREYNRTDGSTIADYHFTNWAVNAGDMAATGNGRLAFIASTYPYFSPYAIGLTDVAATQVSGQTATFTSSQIGGYYTFDGYSTVLTPGNPITACQWSFGDGITANGVQASHRYLTAGQYAVKLTLTTASGTSSFTRVVNVTDPGGVAASLTLDAPATVTSADSFTASAHLTVASGQATGDLIFTANGTVVATVPLDANGDASCQVPSWRGTKTLVVRFSGDATYAAALSNSVAVAIPNVAPTATVQLAPADGEVETSTVLTATATSSDDNHDPVTLTFVWKVNGITKRTFTSATALTDTFDLGAAGHGDRGDTVSVQVTPNDGALSGAAAITSTVVIDTAPTVQDISMRTLPDVAITFTGASFLAGFADPDVTDALQAVRIESLPSHGDLTLGGVAVDAGAEIPSGQIVGLTYTPSAGYSGSDSFAWNGSDGSVYASTSASVVISVRRPAPTSVLIYSATPEVHFGESVQVSVLVAAPTGVSVLPGGTVSFKDDDGTVLATAPVVNGAASCTIGGMARGYHQISAAYSGDAIYRSLASSTPLAVHVGAANVVDVLALYTPSAAQVYSNVRDVIYSALADMNDALVNSQVNLSLEIVDVAQTNYTESGSYSTDLDRLQINGDGYMDEAASLRATYGADLVCLFVGSGQTDGTIGLSYMMQSASASDNANWGYSVVDIGQSTSPVYTLAHELGHNFGAQHDPANSDGPGILSDSYGYRFLGNDGVWYHDIMSYDGATSDVTIPYYSNPNLTYAGQPIGIAGTSNVARTINYTAPIVAAYEPTKVPLVTPTVTSVSAPSSIVGGQPVTLSATITGQLANPHTPDGTVTFLDGDVVLATVTASAGAASWTGTLPAGDTHQIRALYQNDDFFGDSISSASTIGVVAAPTLSNGTLSIAGGSGGDTLTITVSGAQYVIAFDGKTFRYATSAVTAVSIDVGDGNDLVNASALTVPATINGGNGRDTLTGGAAADLINGGAGADVISGGGGADTLLGATGADMLSGSGGADSMLGGAGADTLFGGSGNDFMLGGPGGDVIFGQGGADSILAGAGDDWINSGAGNDTIVGGPGNDLIYSGSGVDDVYLNDGPTISYHDTLYAGTGTDNVDHDTADLIVGTYVDILG